MTACSSMNRVTTTIASFIVCNITIGSSCLQQQYGLSTLIIIINNTTTIKPHQRRSNNSSQIRCRHARRLVMLRHNAQKAQQRRENVVGQRRNATHDRPQGSGRALSRRQQRLIERRRHYRLGQTAQKALQCATHDVCIERRVVEGCQLASLHLQCQRFDLLICAGDAK
jgi:hypothetical protein